MNLCIRFFVPKLFGFRNVSNKQNCSKMLKKEFEYYLSHQEELVGKYNGKFIVIKDQQVVGVYDSEIEAYTKSVKTLELGTFLIQECLSGEESYTQTFRTRVIFNK